MLLSWHSIILMMQFPSALIHTKYTNKI